MSDIELTIQNCLQATQAMIEFLARHQMSYWADRFEQVAKALKIPDADKAVGLQKTIPNENVVRLFDSMASKDDRATPEDAALLMKLTDEVAESFGKLKSYVKVQAKKTNAVKTGLNRSPLKGGDFGATTRSRSGASAPRRTSSS